METELYKKHRPQLLKHVLGQETAVKMLMTWVKKKTIPQSIILTGPSGCGKTTIARILKNKVNCSDHDFKELNTADFRGVDMVRDIRRGMSRSAMGGGTSRMWLIDEVHGMTKDAQNALLKMLEDTPENRYFVLATTDPQKLLTTIKTRCATITLKTVGPKALEQLILGVLIKEDKKLSAAIIDKIVQYAEGSARQALVDLGKVIDLEDEDEQLEAITPAQTMAAAMDLVAAIMPWKGIPQWANVQKVLLKVDQAEIEKIRQIVLTISAKAVIAGGPRANRAILMIRAFYDPFYDSRFAGLVAACHSLFTHK